RADQQRNPNQYSHFSASSSLVAYHHTRKDSVGERISPKPVLQFRGYDFRRSAILRIAARLRSTSSSVVAQLETLIRIAVLPCHWVPPNQQVPSSCTPAMIRRVSSALPKPTST